MTKTLNLKEFLEEDGDKRLSGVSFEQGLKLLEELVAGVESGTLALDKAILSYEKGVALIAHLRGVLNGAERKLEILQKSGAEAVKPAEPGK